MKLSVTHHSPAPKKPYYFQILGSSPIRSAIQQLPFSLVSALASFFSGLVITYTRAYRPVLLFGFVVYTLGQGLMILLDADSSVAVQEITILIGELQLLRFLPGDLY